MVRTAVSCRRVKDSLLLHDCADFALRLGLLPAEVADRLAEEIERLGRQSYGLDRISSLMDFCKNNPLAEWIARSKHPESLTKVANALERQDVEKESIAPCFNHGDNCDSKASLADDYETRCNANSGNGAIIACHSAVSVLGDCDPERQLRIADQLAGRHGDHAVARKLYEKLNRPDRVQALDARLLRDGAVHDLGKHIADFLIDRDAFGKARFNRLLTYGFSVEFDRWKKEHDKVFLAEAVQQAMVIGQQYFHVCFDCDSANKAFAEYRDYLQPFVLKAIGGSGSAEKTKKK
jgi:hypothetical protein